MTSKIQIKNYVVNYNQNVNMFFSILCVLNRERVILGPGLRYCRVWPPDVHTVTVIELNTLLLRCYIVNMLFMFGLCYCRVWPPDVSTVMVIKLNMLLLHCSIYRY